METTFRLSLWILLFVGSVRISATKGAEPSLNIVFILVDDLGWRDLGCYGSTFYETPHLDALAASGVRFTSAYAACQVCSPTRASIQTGKYPARLHTTDYFGGPQPDEALQMPRFQRRPLLPPPYLEQLPLEEVTLAEAFRDAGYTTFFAGKWHLGPKSHWPQTQGYDEYHPGWEGGIGRGHFLRAEATAPGDDPTAENLDMRLAGATARFIAAHRDQPFLALLSLHGVHIPLEAQPDLTAKYETRAAGVTHEGPRELVEGGSRARQVQDHATYAAMVETMDAAAGLVLEAIDAAGVADHTVVIFASDNGGLSTAEGSPTSNVPLRAGKGWMYEGGVRVPLIVRWPGRAQAGATCESYVISTDYYPTLLEMAGLPARPEQHVDGMSFAPLIEEAGQFQRGPVYWHYPHYGNQGGSPASAVRDGDWKLIEFLEDGRLELYNLVQDVGERTDLSRAEAARAARMADQLHAWRESVGAQMPTRNPQAPP